MSVTKRVVKFRMAHVNKHIPAWVTKHTDNQKQKRMRATLVVRGTF